MHPVQPPTLPALFDLERAAELLGTTPDHLRHLVEARKIGSYRVGRYVRFRPEDLAAYLENNRVPARDVAP